MTISRFDELEKRIATLETNMKVAVIVGVFIGVTGSGLVTILWASFRAAKHEVNALEKNAAQLADRVQTLRADIDSNLAATVDNRKQEIAAFAANQMNHAARDARVSFKKSVAAHAWQPLQLRNGWSNNSTGYPNASFYKDAIGIIHLRGIVSGGSGVVGHLPPAYRPAAYMVFDVACPETHPCRAIVSAKGSIWFSPGSSWTSLNEIHFTAQ